MRKLPASLRDALREPIGLVFEDDQKLIRFLQKENYIVSVGDLVTYTLLKHGIIPTISVVDFIIERKQYPSDMERVIRACPGRHIRVKSPAAAISDELWDVLKSSLEDMDAGPVCIEVDGEEDLAGLAALYLAPSDVTIIYGLPNRGVGVMKVTKATKARAKEVLDKM